MTIQIGNRTTRSSLPSLPQSGKEVDNAGSNGKQPSMASRTALLLGTAALLTGGAAANELAVEPMPAPAHPLRPNLNAGGRRLHAISPSTGPAPAPTFAPTGAAARVSGAPAAKQPYAKPGASSAPLTGCTVAGYEIPVQVGTQTFSLVMDSGSSDLWVATAGAEVFGVFPTYQPGPSSEILSPDGPYISYGVGEASGALFEDQVLVAGVAQNISYTLLAADQIQDLLSGTTQAGCADPTTEGVNTAQGIVGIGPNVLSEFDRASLLGAFASEAVIPRNLFATNLCNNGGEVWFGNYDPSASLGALRTVPMVPSSYYAMNITDIALGNTSVGFDPFANPAIVDTGTTVFALPTQQYQRLIDSLDAWSDGIFPAHFFEATQSCLSAAGNVSEAELNALLPPLTVALSGNVSLTLPASLSYMAPYPGANGTVWCPQLDDGEAMGVGTIFGTAMMRGLTVVVDVDGGTVGFAEQDRSRCPSALAYQPGLAFVPPLPNFSNFGDTGGSGSAPGYVYGAVAGVVGFVAVGAAATLLIAGRARRARAATSHNAELSAAV